MPVVEQVRGPCVEARHPFSAVRVQAGRVDTWLGAPVSSTWRSAAKPFQLACALELLGDPDLDETELAVGAASHSGEPVHVDLVRSLLQRFGVQESDLRFAAHPPAHIISPAAIMLNTDKMLQFLFILLFLRNAFSASTPGQPSSPRMPR